MSTEHIPIVSSVLPDGTLLETVFDPRTATTAFAVAYADGGTALLPTYTDANGATFTPYSPTNSLIASKCVLLPSAIGDFGDKGDLIDDIRAYLARYVALSDEFADLVPYYVLLSWVYDDFREIPMLRARGGYGCGKTRFLLAVGSICYKPFFASGASTVSPIFHIIDTFRGTLVLDEADYRFDDKTSELVKLLNNGTVDGLPVLRTMTNRHRELNPKAFRVFGPKLVGMRERFSDDALESRFFTEEMGAKPLPSHIPIHTPASMEDDAQQLRNRLLAWRFAAKGTLRPDEALALPGVPPRMNQMALALLSLIDDEAARSRVASALLTDEQHRSIERQNTDDALLLTAIAEEFAASRSTHIRVGDIADRFNRKTSSKSHLPLSAKAVGLGIRTRLRLITVKSHGVYCVPQSERDKLAPLAARMGISFSPELPDPPPAAAAEIRASSDPT